MSEPSAWPQDPPPGPGQPAPDGPPEPGPPRWLPMGADAALGVAWLVVGLLEVGRRADSYDRVMLTALAMVACAMSLAVALFRREPGLALALVWMACAVQVLWNLPLLLVQLGVAIVAYGTARYGSTAVVWASGLSVPAGYLIGGAYVYARPWQVRQIAGFGWDTGLAYPARALGAGALVFAAASLLIAVPWLLGLLLRTRERLLTGRREHADTERLRAVAEEQRAHAEEVSRVREQQARLARDVHDVVGHSLAVIVAQAESAQYLPDDPARLKETLAAIAGVARVSLRDVRRVLSTAPDDVPAPPPGGLDDLVEGVRASGTVVREVTSGEPVALTGELALVAYRVLQEMLTNAIKHGAAGEPVTVSRLWAEDGLLLEVANRRSSDRTGKGGGLEGMLRRVTGVRGTLRVLEDDTTFVVRAWLPLSPGGR